MGALAEGEVCVGNGGAEDREPWRRRRGGFRGMGRVRYRVQKGGDIGERDKGFRGFGGQEN